MTVFWVPIGLGNYKGNIKNKLKKLSMAIACNFTQVITFLGALRHDITKLYSNPKYDFSHPNGFPSNLFTISVEHVIILSIVIAFYHLYKTTRLQTFQGAQHTVTLLKTGLFAFSLQTRSSAIWHQGCDFYPCTTLRLIPHTMLVLISIFEKTVERMNE